LTDLQPLAEAARSPLASARVAAWTWSEARRLAESLRRDGIDAIDTVQPAPPAAARLRRTVSAVLHLAGATCLVRSAVLQRWDADHDRPRPLVVGVARDQDGGFEAHAWLEGDGDLEAEGFVELHRRPPAAQTRSATTSKRAFLKNTKGSRCPGCRSRRRRARSLASAT
jgi:hypothetical protein